MTLVTEVPFDPSAVSDLAAPWLDDFGLLYFSDSWVALSAQQVIAIRPLLAAWRRGVSTEQLIELLWPDREEGSDRAALLRTVILRLRRRLLPIGLTIEAIRGRGFLLEPLVRPDRPLTAGALRPSPEGTQWPIS